MSAAPRIRGLLESALYVEDVGRARDFYVRLFEFPVLTADDRLCALDVAGGAVLLLFLKGATDEPVRMPGGVIPAHHGAGHLHLAFAVAADDLPRWEDRLRDAGIPIESRTRWPRGGDSIYFRDPDSHLVELVTPGVWQTY